MSVSNSSKQAKARDLKHRVLTCLHKLSDRDTHSAAASELESIARTITADALPSFISSISTTDASDKSPVRRQCLRLITVLSEHHGNRLSPYLSKLLSAVVRRLRDHDSSVRSACVAASLSLSSHLTSTSFNLITKPFLESLFTEQEFHAQSSAALCLEAIIQGSRIPEAGSLRRLLPRLEKLAKSHNFKAKAALLSLIGSIIEMNGVLNDSGNNVVRNLIDCLMEFLSSEDWAARKAAAEALMKMATTEKEGLSEYKISCLKLFEAKRFDKVKATRETMNQMIEAWKEIPDPSDDEISPLPEPEASSKEITSESKTLCSVGLNTPRMKKSIVKENPVARKRSPLSGSDDKTGRPIFQKLDRKKPLEVDVVIHEDSPPSNDGDERKQNEQPGIKCARALFSENNGMQKLNAFKTGSRVVPCHDTDFVVDNEAREVEDLSLIRKHLLQIENQQSNLLSILQRYIGSSQSGMHSLEARVQGLELALDEISFDLGRISQNGAPRAMCCRLPGAGLLNSMFWSREKERARRASQPFGPGRIPSAANGGHGIIANPLAKISIAPLGFSGPSSSGGVVNNGAI